MIYFNNEFWLARELNKVRNPRRQVFLRGIFSGDNGWQKFVTLMRTRKGADEFRTGEWPVKIPKYSKAELELKKSPCIYCGDLILPPKFSPWGELCEDIIPICQRCLQIIKINNKNQNQNMENQNAENKVAVVAAINPSTEPTDSSHLSGVTLEEMVARFQNLKPETGC